MGRWVRRNYLWLLAIQSAAYAGKLMVHPTAVRTTAEFIERARLGPVPSLFVLLVGIVYLFTWAGLAVWIWSDDLRRTRNRSNRGGIG